jgi:hypothetical protein
MSVVVASRRNKRNCIYCSRPANSREHIIATRFIKVLREDPRGLKLPIVLTVTLDDATQRHIVGRKTKRGQHTLEYTTRVCDRCNSGWMNDIDSAAYEHLAEMIRGNPTQLDRTAQAAIASWMCKVAITARSVPHSPLPIEKEWTDWLYEHRSALPKWNVWIGHFVGNAPWWYNPHDVRIELGPGSAPPPPGFVRNNGVLATLVIGYLIVQVFGIGGDGVLGNPDRERALPMIWPPQDTMMWPPQEHIDDAGLPLCAGRLLGKPPAQPG